MRSDVHSSFIPDCVNWHGTNEKGAMFGLHAYPLHWWVKSIRELGFNCVRLPISLQNVLDGATRVDNELLSANPALQNMSSLQILDACIEALTQADFVVVINIHTLANRNCCTDRDGEGLWYTSHRVEGMASFSEGQFFDAVTRVARRYRSNALVAAFDLKNEIRPDRDVFPWLLPSWGGGDIATDWTIAAKRAGLLVLAEDKDMILIVSAMNFGQYLCDVVTYPLHLDESLQGHIVYTVHHYEFFYIPGYFVRVISENINAILGCSCVYTTAVLLLASFVPRWWPPDRVHLTHPGDAATATQCRVPILFSVVACASYVAWGVASTYCGLVAEISRLCFECLLCFLFTGFAIVMWTRIACRRGLAAVNVQSLFAQFLDSWLFPALGFQFVILLMCAYIITSFQTYSKYAKTFDASWGFLGSCSSVDPARTAPVWISEFGVPGDPPEEAVAWWPWFLRYMSERNFAGFSYWPLTNGSMSIFDRQLLLRRGTGLLDNKWQDFVLKPLQHIMRDPMPVPRC
ncbi:unnamed protein product [Prorocentrum cordatum]|uniref:Glycoside hydrolase family 5 domain-containing protein n=1 Tax=Prorocentrum cordatum TaxID=2364126 RepID=A0ABN9V9Z0_9DINO|nr:unnamed protein product [Polarella glacialis]